MTRPLISQLIDGIDSRLKGGIIRSLYFSHQLSAVDLSNLLDKSVPVIAKALGELLTDGWVEEAGHAPSSGGRRPLLYTLNKSSIYIIAISIDRLGGRIAIVNLQNTPIIPTRDFELSLMNNDMALPDLIGIISNTLFDSGISPRQVLGVGLTLPGFVDHENGVSISYLNNTGKLSLVDYLQRALQLPVYIDNDSSAIALAEFHFGRAKGFEDAMVINIGWGIGLGMVVNGTLFRGATGFAGELSHIPISDSGKLCYCGKKGCLETEATLSVVAEKVQEEIKKGMWPELEEKNSLFEMSEYLIREAKNGNADVSKRYQEMGFKIGKALAILVHITNPDVIVLSGRGSVLGCILVDPIQAALKEYCIPKLYEKLKVEVSEIHNDAQLLGAAALIMERF